MSVRISNTQIKFKDENGTYQDVNAISPEAPVQDVQVNGTSIVHDGVANVPKGSANNHGVYKIDTRFGVRVLDYGTYDGLLAINAAGAPSIKEGVNANLPIVPERQHYSAFYGLAKAAGVDMASSSNAVGEYTDEAKIAIQKMLGIYEPPWELIRTITLEERASVDVTVDDNGNPFELLQAFVYVLYGSNLVTESSGYGRYYIYDANNDSINSETGRYVASENPTFKEMLFEKKGNMKLAHYTNRTTLGNSASWLIKRNLIGIKLNVGNIVRIKMDNDDFEPAGTKITIYGQRAY